MNRNNLSQNKTQFIKYNKSRPILILIVVLVFLLILPITNRGYIAIASREDELVSEIKRLEAKIESAKKQVDSLSKEIDLIEGDIELKTAQIKQANYAIEQKTKELEALQGDIELLEVRLDRLGETIDYHRDLLSQRLKRQYIETQQSPFELFFSNEEMGDAIARIKYLEKVEAQDRALIKRMNDTKGNYENQQDLLEKKKDQVESIKKEIENQKAQAEQLKNALEAQRQNKDNLLRVTKNNEKRYKELLEQAQKELSQIQSAANIVVREGKAVKVKKGEVIGTMGNSGYSTGAHLHFGIYKYNVDDFQTKSNWGWYYSNYVNPIDKLESKTVIWGTGCSRDPSGSEKSGKGDMGWPMSSPRITQNFGSNTCYNWMYGGKPHPALDMVGSGDISIKSIDDGEAYFCRNCLGDGGNGVFVFHENDLMSVYWHLR